ncbi:LacI family transcriptional regulator [Rhizomicrobium palustre]|uniref:LacI family transcriptional regulator n=1 Tax=Rhizomicrobium palustre TaxID=189966 RepID=A0A846MU30_9PROT|nr:substrate-binding domain-containing protein [Rhizomicrobium palustre]NIK86856.1 LacI family transcriptional regulator [Rhizomicrobium palustre]
MVPRRHLIGFFCDTPMVGSGYLAMLQIGLMAGCRKWDSALLIKSFEFAEKDIPDQVRHVILRNPLDGVVLPEPMCDMEDVLDVLFAAGIPVVRITPHSPNSRTLDICIDNFQAGYDLTTYLIGLGHKRIGFVRGPSDHRDAQVRYDGFCQAMGDAGLPITEAYCPAGNFEFSSGLQSAEKLLSLAEPPSAIFACNDEIAAAVLAVCHSRGINVPEDLSLAGFDDAPIARVVWPPLTTCRQKMELTGYMAVDFLIEPPHSAEMRRRPQQHELVIRKSTSRPKG